MLLSFQIIITSLSLAIIYGSYLITFEYVTYMYKDIGFISYVLVFGCNIITSIMAPFITYYILGIKKAILLGSLIYIIWILMFNTGNIVCILVGSVLVGLGSGIIRTQQNVWITSLDISMDRDYYIGLYNTIFGLNGIFGSIFSIVVILLGINFKILIWILAIVSIIAFICLLFMNDIQLGPSHTINIKAYAKLFIDWKLALTLPIVLYQAINVIFSFGVMPLFVNNELTISIMFLIYGISYCINSYVLGYITRYIDMMVVLLSMILVSIVLSSLLLYTVLQKITNNQYYYLVIGLLNGYQDSTISFTIIRMLTSFESKSVYSINRAMYCFFCATYSMIYINLNIYQNIIILNIGLLGGILFYIIFNVFHKKDNLESKI